MKRSILTSAFALSLLFLTACSHFRATRDESTTDQPGVEHKYHSFLWGFVPGRLPPAPDVLCPQSQIQTLDFRMKAVDVLVTSATVGIYVPHRVTITCSKR